MEGERQRSVAPGGLRQDLDEDVGPGDAGPFQGNQGAAAGPQDFGAGGQRRGGPNSQGALDPTRASGAVTDPTEPMGEGEGFGTAASGADVTGGSGSGDERLGGGSVEGAGVVGGLGSDEGPADEAAAREAAREAGVADVDVGGGSVDVGGGGAEGYAPVRDQEEIDLTSPQAQGINDQDIEDLRADGERDLAAEPGYATDHRGFDGTQGGIGDRGRGFFMPDAEEGHRPGQETGLP